MPEHTKQDAIPGEDCICKGCGGTLVTAEKTVEWDEATEKGHGETQAVNCPGCSQKVLVTLV